MKRAKFGVVFDIDGVLMKSDKAIPEARGALNLLNDHPKYVKALLCFLYFPSLLFIVCQCLAKAVEFNLHRDESIFCFLRF